MSISIVSEAETVIAFSVILTLTVLAGSPAVPKSVKAVDFTSVSSLETVKLLAVKLYP